MKLTHILHLQKKKFNHIINYGDFHQTNHINNYGDFQNHHINNYGDFQNHHINNYSDFIFFSGLYQQLLSL